MKKNTLGILAGLCVLLTGCGGTKYVKESHSSDDKAFKETKETLSLGSRKENAGEFTLSTKTTEEYADGYFSGFLGLGEVDGDVKAVTTKKSTGTWSLNEDTGIVTLVTLEVSVQVKLSGDGAADYKDFIETEYTIAFDEEKGDLVAAGEKVTVSYEDGIKSYVKLLEEEKSFTYDVL